VAATALHLKSKNTEDDPCPKIHRSIYYFLKTYMTLLSEDML
jgi:hypothetical protein